MVNQTKARKLANTVLAALEKLTCGQGQATIGVFDAGAGGGFVTGSLYICLERDGLILDQKRYERAEFLDLLTAALLQGYPDFPIPETGLK